MKYSFFSSGILVLIFGSITVFAYHNPSYSYAQVTTESSTQPRLITESSTQPGLITESSTQPGLITESSTQPAESSGSRLARHCESPTQPGLFVLCEFPAIDGSNTEFCESETQPGLFLLCDKPSPKPVSYCESEIQPGLFVLCVKSSEAKSPELDLLEQRVIKLEAMVNNITNYLDALKENQNASSSPN